MERRNPMANKNEKEEEVKQEEETEEEQEETEEEQEEKPKPKVIVKTVVKRIRSKSKGPDIGKEMAELDEKVRGFEKTLEKALGIPKGWALIAIIPIAIVIVSILPPLIKKIKEARNNG
jgi:hypothetical protein